MARTLLLGLLGITISACDSSQGTVTSDVDSLSIEEAFYSAREAAWQDLETAAGFENVTLKSATSVLQYRYEGERLMAYLQPEHYCVARKRDADRAYYRFYPSELPPGGGINFCVTSEGEVTDLVLEE